MPKLKPCPFCGYKAKVYQAQDGYWQVECPACFARGCRCKAKDLAIEKWNWRVYNERTH